jgi:molecular chaperone DnaJ
MSNSSRRGDMYIKIQVNVPKHLSSSEKKILKDLESAQSPSNEPQPIFLKDL